MCVCVCERERERERERARERERGQKALEHLAFQAEPKRDSQQVQRFVV